MRARHFWCRFFGASFALQLPVGFFVDRFGARNILMAGVVILAACTLLYGVFTSYPALVLLTIIAGAANSVFHPADYSILNASVKSERLGRAFSVHNFAGFAGYGLAPVLVAWLGSLWGWQTASIVTGAVGLFFVFFVFALSSDFQDSSDTRRDEGRPSSLSDDLKTLMQGPLLLCLLFFTLLAAGQLGAQWFADDVLHIGHGIPVIEGNSYVTIFVVGISIGIIMGRSPRDRSANHIRLASIGFVACGIGTISMGLAPPQAGICIRCLPLPVFFLDLASRPATCSYSLAPKGASGAVFGFVFSGLDIGSMSIPLVYGYFLGVGMEFYVFYLGGILIVLAAGILGAAGKNAAQA